MKENETGEACKTHAKGEKYIQHFKRPLSRPRRRWEDIDRLHLTWGKAKLWAVVKT
jgi:hypothetical protein